MQVFGTQTGLIQYCFTNVWKVASLHIDLIFSIFAKYIHVICMYIKFKLMRIYKKNCLFVYTEINNLSFQIHMTIISFEFTLVYCEMFYYARGWDEWNKNYSYECCLHATVWYHKYFFILLERKYILSQWQCWDIS